ncbi:MAG: DUF2264 domain-containing protein [Prevotella sp.]|jgi:hypothetical protein|nr:DUF2264 domain-containing protein [Prevotella sp.]
MKRTLSLFIFLCVILYIKAGEPNPSMRKLIDEAMQFSVNQSMYMYDQLKNQEGKLPKTSENGQLVTCNSGWWTSGFYPGTLWYLYEYANDASIKQAAQTMTTRVEPEKYTTSNHDVGFIINCSFGNGYRLTRNESYRDVINTAAQSLSTRFHPVTGCTRSWNSKKWQFSVIIDNMMNLELLSVSSAYSGDNKFYNMALSHADKTMKNHYRDNFSSYHVVSYDTITGKVISQVTHQGVSDNSSWSRGQAWGLYGFTMMYRESGDRRYLDFASNIAEYIINHPNMPKDKIPYWDFDAPNIPKEDRDASAGAIMASALVELSTYLDGELSALCLKTAETQIKSLASKNYRAKKIGDNAGFILMHSTGFMAKKSEIDVPLSYADYYFVEAMSRYKRLLDKKDVVDVIAPASKNKDRAFWISSMVRIIDPVLSNLSANTLKQNMPVESSATDIEKRKEVTHLEAFGRTLTGIAPWLELGEDNTVEGRLRGKYIAMTLECLKNCVDPNSPDNLNFNNGRQPLVDAAFLAHGLLRAKTQTWDRLDKTTQLRLIEALKSTRIIKPSETNWLFFSAMIEAALKEFAGEWNVEVVNYALQKHKDWYKGDAWYGDGSEFHLDYYNSFVIQPMMVQVLDVMKKYNAEGADFYDIQLPRYVRYAEQQERMISPEGAYPVIGRSLAYRFGAFQALADVTYRKILPQRVSPAQVRSALTAVIKRQITAPGTFNQDGWLKVGFCGDQIGVGESYISTGSLYLCSGVFLPLGLNAGDDFWNSKAQDWTSKKAYSGQPLYLDKAYKN